MCTSHCPTGVSRRDFTRLAVAGGLGLLPWRAWAAQEVTAPLADTLAIMCIDYRLVDPTMRTLDRITSGSKKFDLVAMAGASLAGTHTTEFPAEYDGLWEQVRIATTVHPLVKKVIVVDHRECGAYEAVYGPLTGDEEKKKHLWVMGKVKRELSLRHLESQFWLMSKAGNDWTAEELFPALLTYA